MGEPGGGGPVAEPLLQAGGVERTGFEVFAEGGESDPFFEERENVTARGAYLFVMDIVRGAKEYKIIFSIIVNRRKIVFGPVID